MTVLAFATLGNMMAKVCIYRVRYRRRIRSR